MPMQRNCILTWLEVTLKKIDVSSYVKLRPIKIYALGLSRILTRSVMIFPVIPAREHKDLKVQLGILMKPIILTASLYAVLIAPRQMIPNIVFGIRLEGLNLYRY
jgi:hypothetical protein